MSIKGIVFIYLFWLIPISTYAQLAVKKVQTIFFNEEANLNSNTVNDIYIDSLNQIWLINGSDLLYFNGKDCSVIARGNWSKIINARHSYYGADTYVHYIDIQSRKVTLNKKDNSLSLVNINTAKNEIFFTENNGVFKGQTIEYNNKCQGESLIEVKKDSFVIHINPKQKYHIPAAKNLANFYYFSNNQFFYITLARDVMRYDVVRKKSSFVNLKVQANYNVIRMNVVPYKDKGYILSINNQLYLLDNNYLPIYEFRQSDGKHLTESMISAINSDKYDNIYIGTLTNGLIKLVNNSLPIKYYGIKSDKNFFTKSIYVNKKNNEVVIGTWGKGLYVFDTLNNLKYTIKHPTLGMNYTPSYIFGNDPNRLFVSIFTETYLHFLHKAKDGKYILQKTNLNSNDGFEVSEHRISENETNVFQTFGKLIRLKKDQIYERDFKNMSVLSHTFQGRYLITSSFNEVNIFDTSDYKIFKTIPINFNTAHCQISFDKDKTLIGTHSGLYILDLKTSQIKKYLLDGVPVFSLINDKHKNIWIGTAKGIYKLDQQKLLTWFSKYDGLQDWEFNSNCVFETKDGELFFGGLKGANSFYPDEMIKVNNFDYFIDRIQTTKSNFNYRIKEKSTIYLPSDDRSVTLYFGSIGTFLPQQYNRQYFIEGISKYWVDMKYDDKLTQVLNYGSHKIYYHSSLQFDSQAPLKKYIIINVKTPILNSWWFWVLTTIALGILTSYLITFYQKLKFERTKAEWEAKETLMKERNRVSRDLHDSIGAQLSIISRNIDWLKDNKDRLPANLWSEKLEQIEKLSTKTNAELRDTIWATKKEEINVVELVDRLKNFSYAINHDFFKAVYIINSDNYNINPILAINLLRICQEAIINAYKYSCSNAILITFNSHLETNLPVVEIKDGGIGFDVNNIKMGYGLQNMRDRAKEANYNIIIESTPEKGTTITLFPL